MKHYTYFILFVFIFFGYLQNGYGQKKKKVYYERSSEAIISCSESEGNYVKINVSIPHNATILRKGAQMKNRRWDKGCCCADLGSSGWANCPIDSGECDISWSKVRDYVETIEGDRKVCSARFYNWRSDNERTGKLTIHFTTPKPLKGEIGIPY
jgi:hypothetical protein